MATPPPAQDSISTPTVQTSPTPLKCFGGALISGALATAIYFLTLSIAQTFAAKPILSSNAIAIRISIAVRTLVVGMTTMATVIFGIATLGLIALGIQLLVKRSTPSP